MRNEWILPNVCRFETASAATAVAATGAATTTAAVAAAAAAALAAAAAAAAAAADFKTPVTLARTTRAMALTLVYRITRACHPALV